MKYLNEKSELSEALMETYAKTSNDLVMAHFFFFDQGKSTLQMSREGALRSLLHQVLRGKEEFWNTVFYAGDRS
jgi:hypothetical protein